MYKVQPSIKNYRELTTGVYKSSNGYEFQFREKRYYIVMQTEWVYSTQFSLYIKCHNFRMRFAQLKLMVDSLQLSICFNLFIIFKYYEPSKSSIVDHSTATWQVEQRRVTGLDRTCQGDFTIRTWTCPLHMSTSLKSN